MPAISSEVYDAFRDAGASDETAHQAAAALARYDHRLDRIEADLSQLRWLAGANVVLTAALLWKLWMP